MTNHEDNQWLILPAQVSKDYIELWSHHFVLPSCHRFKSYTCASPPWAETWRGVLTKAPSSLMKFMWAMRTSKPTRRKRSVSNARRERAVDRKAVWCCLFFVSGYFFETYLRCDQMWQYHCSDRCELHHVSIHFSPLFFVERSFRTAGFAAFLLLGFTLWQSFLNPKLSLTEGLLSSCVRHLYSFILMFQVEGASKGCICKKDLIKFGRARV